MCISISCFRDRIFASKTSGSQFFLHFKNQCFLDLLNAYIQQADTSHDFSTSRRSFSSASKNIKSGMVKMVKNGLIGKNTLNKKMR